MNKEIGPKSYLLSLVNKKTSKLASAHSLVEF